MKAELIKNIKNGNSYESEIERAWQLSGIEFDETDEKIIEALSSVDEYYWQIGSTTEEITRNEGNDGYGTREEMEEAEKEWSDAHPDGYILRAWQKANEDSEPDVFIDTIN